MIKQYLALLALMTLPGGAFALPLTQSDSFIIRWGFQEYCDHVFDPTVEANYFPTDESKITTFDPKEVKRADIIFVRDAKKFFETLHPFIENSYIIVTHGQSRERFKEDYLPYLEDEKVIAWFTIHTAPITHTKLIPIPLGIKQVKHYYYEERNLINNYFNELRKSAKPKLLYLNFLERTHDERSVVADLFKDKAFCTNGKRGPFRQYLKEMSQCKFTLSPRGVGIDAYRTWESLMVGSIPIVKSSQLNVLYEDLPVLIIDDWEEITEEFLNKKYKEIKSRNYSLEKLYMNYWRKRMEEVRQSFLSSVPHEKEAAESRNNE